MKTLKYVLAAALVLASSSCRDSGNGQRDDKDIPVRVINVHRQSDISTETYVGNVIPGKTALITGSYPGTLVCMNVSQGDLVRKGDTMAVIDSKSVKGSYDMAQATLRQAEDGYRRAAQVYGSGSIPDVKMVEIETQLEKARSAAETAARALEDCNLKAPFDGIISEILAEEGVELKPAEPILRIVDISSVEIRFQVPENEIGKMQQGNMFEIEVPAAGVSFSAVLKSRGIVASPVSHSYSCTAIPASEYKDILPGMVCKIRRSQKENPSVLVPASVIRTDAEGRYVWTVKDGKVCKRHIIPGGFSGKDVIIKSGLEDGDAVITDGIQKVSSGMNVRIVR